MLTGESGVGKDLMARHIHERSARSGKPFVPVCIPMMSPSLLESELFGYVEGAFTGSMRKGKTGLFEAANGGTVFLDEVGDIPLELQVKLLRVLENQEIIRVGGTEPTHLDIRIISATNRDIPSMVEQGLFREDLYYRLGSSSFASRRCGSGRETYRCWRTSSSTNSTRNITLTSVSRPVRSP